MKHSLKTLLKDYIKQRGYASYQELEDIARINGYKVSNMERRIREICHEENIKPITNNKKHIIGYQVFKKERSEKSSTNLSWKDKLRLEREKYKIENLPRDKNGKIIACS